MNDLSTHERSKRPAVLLNLVVAPSRRDPPQVAADLLALSPLPRVLETLRYAAASATYAIDADGRVRAAVLTTLRLQLLLLCPLVLLLVTTAALAVVSPLILQVALDLALAASVPSAVI